VPLRNRALPAVMAFVAQAAGRRIMCYATANVLRTDAEHLVPKFAVYWKEQTGQFPSRLLFDSRATTYAGLNTLNQYQVGFITIRRRGSSMLARVQRLPAASWQGCQVIQAKGKRRQVKYVDETVHLHGYEGSVRQLIVTGLGHTAPTFFLTNDRPQRQTARKVIQTYASRNHVENRLGEQITFFHLNCLCSDVRLNVDFDLTLTVVADLLYRGLAERLKGFAQASPNKVFRKFVDTPGSVNDHGGGDRRAFEQTGSQPAADRGRPDTTHWGRAVAGWSQCPPGVSVTGHNRAGWPQRQGTFALSGRPEN
jgi:hypothetical protein